MSIYEHKNSLRTIEAQIVQKLKNNETRAKFTGPYKKKRVLSCCKNLSLRYIYPGSLAEKKLLVNFFLFR